MKCCKCGVETRETVSAPYPGAEQYCLACGVCPRCGGSVAAFQQQAGRWFCVCMIAMQKDNAVRMAELAAESSDARAEGNVIPFPRIQQQRYDYRVQPNWEEYGFIRVNGAWREKYRYERELKESQPRKRRK